jgi:hypothetical protein
MLLVHRHLSFFVHVPGSNTCLVLREVRCGVVCLYVSAAVLPKLGTYLA